MIHCWVFNNTLCFYKSLINVDLCCSYNMRRFIVIFFLLVVSRNGFAQQTDTTAIDNNEDEGAFVIPDNSDPLKIGIKFGAGTSTMLGTEMTNSTLSIGLDGSVFFRYRFKPRFAVQTELGASFRGSNFEKIIGNYSAIKTYNLDIPVTLVFALDKTKTSNLVAGIQYSYLLNSSMYKYGQQLPEADAPGLNKNDILAIVGTQFYTPFVGFQVLAKYGLTDINEGKAWPSLVKPDNTGGSIHNFSVELNFLF